MMKPTRDAAYELILAAITEAIRPESMGPREALDFLEELSADIDAMMRDVWGEDDGKEERER